MPADAVILAAGSSSRMGTNKMLLGLSGKTVIESSVETYYDICDDIIVVGGYEIEKIKPVLGKYARVRLIFNAGFSDGMFGSVRVGLSAVTGARFFLAPGDCPIVKKATILEMCKTNEPLLVASHNKRPGHPVLMQSSHIPKILSGDYKSLREYIFTHSPAYLDTCDTGVVTDIDSPEDYNRLVHTG